MNQTHVRFRRANGLALWMGFLAVAACGNTSGGMDAGADARGDGNAADAPAPHDGSGSDARSDVATHPDGTVVRDSSTPPDVTPPTDVVQPDVFVPPGCATPRPRPTITADQAIGVNGVFNDHADHYYAFGAAREYHDWQWDEGNGDSNYPGYPNNQNKFDPSYPAPDWHFDAFYRTQHDHTPSVLVSPDIIGSATGWLTPGWQIPARAGRDYNAAASYIEHADHMFQYAARYGSVAVSDSLLKLASDQARTTGAGLLGYYEDGNEPNSWWVGDPTVTFTPGEYAAMASADYDGDCGRMPSTVGVRNADPNARMAMAGLSSDNQNNIDLAFLDGIKAWADANRQGSFPADVINVHHYCNGGGYGISPEQDNLKQRLSAFVAWRDANAPGRETWLSEFGWDTNPASPQRAGTFGSLDIATVQGAWIVRGFMAAFAAGVDRSFVFMLTDPNENDATQYSSGGLVWHGGSLPSGVNDRDPKPSWYFVSTMHSRLAGMTFAREVDSGDPNVTVYAFGDAANHRGAFVLWCPTSNDTHVANYSLALPAGASSATRVNLAAGSVNGNEAALSLSSGRVSVDVSEVPVFVMVDAAP